MHISVRGRTTQGQVLVIFAGGLVAMMAIAALVIDLGFVFVVRREAQNVADPAAIAAARYIRATGGTYGDMVDAACKVAHQNGLYGGQASTAACTPANDPQGTSMAVNYPPSAAAGTFQGRPGFVEVVVSRNHGTFLAGVVGIRLFTVSSSAVAAFSSGDSNSSSLIALDSTDRCATGKIHGSGTINIHRLPGVTSGGYVQVNSSCSNGPANTTCSASGGALKIDGNASNYTAPTTYVVGSCQATSGFINGGLVEGAPVTGDPLSELAAPDLADYPAGRCSPTGPPLVPGASGCTFSGGGPGGPVTIALQPGVYYGGWRIRNNVTLQLAEGLYIMAGGGVSLNTGGSITSVSGAGGAPAPVMLFNTDDPSTRSGQADLSLTATSALTLRPIASGPYRNILIWNDGNGSNPDASIFLGGQTTLNIAGTIYSPKGLVTMEGGSGVGSPTNTAAVQIIAWQWDIGGNGTLDMPYDPAGLYQLDQKGLVR
jgi:hypothetical protein